LTKAIFKRCRVEPGESRYAGRFKPISGMAMTVIDDVKVVLTGALGLGQRGSRLTADSTLLGGIPEFDSMAVVTVITMLEEHFGFMVEDDEIDADVFETVGSLSNFVTQKLASLD